MKYVLSFISAMLLFTACSKDDDVPAFERTKATRAVLIYMAAENNLTYNNGIRFMKNDLEEIVEGSKLLSDNQRVILFVDSMATNRDYKGTPYIAEVHGGKTYTRKTYDSDFYSSDPARLREMVSWMTTNIEADSYALVLWGHASGWLVTPDTIASANAGRRAYGLDENEDVSGGDKWMNITQMAKALEGLPKMDFIFADCCNMMCAEVGYELRNATNYLIGSPAEIPGPGAPYELVMPYFFKNGSEMYRGIIDTYYDYYTDLFEDTELDGYSVPLSVIDTKYMEQLAQQTKSILTTFVPQYPQELYLEGIPFYWYTSEPILYDMRAFLRRHVDNKDLDAWEKVYNLAVPYYRMSGVWMTILEEYYEIWFYPKMADECGCVSMFIPQDLTAYTSGEFCFNKTSTNFAWNRIIDWSQYGW